MKIKHFLSFVMAAAIIFTTSIFSETVNATKNGEDFTSENLKEFILSGAIPNNIQQTTTLTPDLSGEVTFSEPFVIPYYDMLGEKISIVPNTWSSAIFCNNKITAIAMFSYENKQSVLKSILYLPSEFANKISSGEKYSVFLIDAGNVDGWDNGNLMYSVNSNGENVFIMREMYTHMNTMNSYDLQTDKSDYKKISEYNSITNDMGKAVTVDYVSPKALSNGDIVSFKCFSGSYWKYKDSSSFIVHVVGVDEIGETIYSLAPINKPKSRITISKSSKLYIRCAVGGTVPTYQVCSATNPQKALTMDNSNAKVKNWTGQESQEWIIYVTKN